MKPDCKIEPATNPADIREQNQLGPVFKDGTLGADTAQDTEAVPTRFSSASAQETFDLGLKIGRCITAKSVVLLSGELGAGKTVLAKGIAAGLGIDPVEVSSPSFTLINIHDGGRLRLYHVDLYRLESISAGSLGLDEIFEDPSGITVIEWAERLSGPIPPGTAIKIEYSNEDARNITVTAPD